MEVNSGSNAENLSLQAVRFRMAELTDIPSLVNIYNEVVENTTATFEEFPRLVEETEATYRKKQMAGIPWLVAEVGREVVGYGTYGPFRAASGYKTTVEHSLHIKPEHRGRGIGAEILRRLISLARGQGFHVMIGAVDSDNLRSVALHENFGFKKVGELPQVARKFSRWLDLTLMQLNLNE